MLGDVARQPADLLRQLAQLLPERRIFASRKTGKVFQFVGQSVRPHVRQFRDQLDFTERQIERLADLAHCRSQTIGRKRAHQPRVLGAVAGVDAADQLFADLAREIEVDVGYRRECLVQESSQKESVGDRVDVGQAEEIAHDGGDRGAASPAGQQIAAGAPGAAANVGGDLAGKIEKVVVDEKEAAELVVLDE